MPDGVENPHRRLRFELWKAYHAERVKRDLQELREAFFDPLAAAIDVPPLADDFDGMDMSCGHNRVPMSELVDFFVTNGWRQSKQELVAKLLEMYDVVRKG